uniref:Putative beclin-like protein n=1 Tax=Corethrella appendiculata TaxID=1370023 RepID=U5EZ51_9DIPT
MNDTKVSVNFSCQRCLQPIKIDDCFNNINEHTLAELSLPINVNNPDVDIESYESELDHFVPPFRFTTDSVNDNNGFMLLSDAPDNESISQNFRVKAELFDALSNNSEIDYPLCDECADALLELMDKQLKMAEDEWNDYNNYLKKLELTDDVPNIDQLEKELSDLKNDEGRLLKELQALSKEEDALKNAIKTQEIEKQRLENDEEKYWREYTKHRRDLITTEDEFRSLECQLSYAQNQLDKLEKTNVFNVTFHIWHQGHFGTINNFRLGRLPSAPVDWSEINAAWGQTVLLLSSLARKMNLTFKNYKLVPYGNHSYIESLNDGKELPLYGSGGFRFFWDTKFDSAMVAFLDCLQQFKEEVEKGDSGFCLPYRMEKGKIEDSATGNSYSIKIQFNSEEQWTKALKFLLINLKWGLTWVSSQFTEDRNVV